MRERETFLNYKETLLLLTICPLLLRITPVPEIMMKSCRHVNGAGAKMAESL